MGGREAQQTSGAGTWDGVGEIWRESERTGSFAGCGYCGSGSLTRNGGREALSLTHVPGLLLKREDGENKLMSMAIFL